MTPPKPDFAPAVLKVERAFSHIAKFDRAANQYFARYPHSVSMQPIERRGMFGYGVGERLPFPNQRFALFVGDAVHNLRTALDYLVSACASARGQPCDHTAFPIVDRESQLKDRLKRDVAPAGALVQNLVAASRPYRRGCFALHALHRLDIEDKHRLVLPVASSVAVDVTTGGWNALDIIRVSGRVSSAHARGRRIAVPPGYETALPMDMHYEGDILFARGGPMAGKPCLETLRELATVVTDVIERFETAHGCVPLSMSLRPRVPRDPPAAPVARDEWSVDPRLASEAE